LEGDKISNLIEISELAVGNSKKLGVDEVEGFVQRQRIIEVLLERGEIQSERVKIRRGIGIRAIKDKSVGFSFASVLDERTIRETCKDAFSLARASPKNPDWVSLPLPKRIPPAPDGLYDDDLSSLTSDEALNIVLEGYETAKEVDPRVSIDEGKLIVSSTEIAISNSHGISLYDRGTSIAFYLICVAKEKGKASSFAYEYDISRTLKGFSARKVGELAAKKALLSLGAKSIRPFRGDVILSPDVASEILFAPLISSVNADNVQRGRSLWANRIGESVSVRSLTIIDDGLLPYGLGSSPFDAEGVPSQRTIVIENGVLKSFLYDSYTANKANRESTGNAAREGYSSPPYISASNLLVSPGTKSLEEMISEVDRGVIVNRFSGKVSNESGEFSGIAKQAIYIEDGEMRFPLRETMISGNTFESLNKIAAIGRDRRATMMDVYTPPILIEEITITSK